jgi:8-oxo-dGTP pyrophosphatase MutT (NUDIX family)
MGYEASYGVIPLRNKEGIWQVLLIQHQAGHWGFPKGHAERKEQPKQAATRELLEETGLTIVCYLSEQPLIEAYQFFSRGKRIEKTVTYFLAKVEGELKLQCEEIKDAKWIPLSEAVNHLTFSVSKAVCQRAETFLSHIEIQYGK